MRRGARRPSTRFWGAAAFLALLFAFAWPMQVNGFNQTAHYALAKALADGEPYVDRTLGEVGDLSSGDVARFQGHVYAVKAPGLAMLSVPAVLAARAAGMRMTGDPTRGIWVLHLLGAALAGVLLALLVRDAADGLAPGTGTATAVVAALGTLLLPFSTLYFAHVLSATLGFAAFALLLRERRRPGPRLVAAAGVAAGLAIVAEYQLALLVPILACYCVSRGDVVRRVLTFGGGVVAGVVPLLAFNVWAFGSLTHTPYDDYWNQLEGSPDASLYRLPDLGRIADSLLDANGLLVLSPVLALVPVGLVRLWRGGARAEVTVVGAIVAAYLLYVSILNAEGGLGAPRYLITMLPFAAVGLAGTVRAFPLTTLCLGAVSAFQMAVVTATGALASYDGAWLSRLADRNVVRTAAEFADVTGWYAVLPFFAAVVVAALCAAASATAVISTRELGIACGALALWAILAVTSTNPDGRAPGTSYALTAAVVVGGLAAVLALASPDRRGAAPAAAEELR
jgi:hypothetical protein